MSNGQDRVRTTLVDFALGRTPNSSGVRLTILRDNPVIPAVGFGSLASGLSSLRLGLILLSDEELARTVSSLVLLSCGKA